MHIGFFTLLVFIISVLVFIYRSDNINVDDRKHELSNIVLYASLIALFAYLCSPVVYVISNDGNGVNHEKQKYVLWYSYRDIDGNKRSKFIPPFIGHYIYNDTPINLQLKPIIYGDLNAGLIPKRQVIRSRTVEKIPTSINYFFKEPRESIRSKTKRVVRWGLYYLE